MPADDPISPQRFCQPDLANVLEAIGREGADAFYRGDISKTIISDIRDNGGLLSETDLDRYQPFVWKNGLELGYRGHTLRVPPYASAGITSAMTMKLLEGFDLSAMGHNSVDMLHTYIACARLAYADRFAYLTDPDFADVPWNGLMSNGYTTRRRKTIHKKVLPVFEPGDPWVEERRSISSFYYRRYVGSLGIRKWPRPYHDRSYR